MTVTAEYLGVGDLQSPIGSNVDWEDVVHQVRGHQSWQAVLAEVAVQLASCCCDPSPVCVVAAFLRAATAFVDDLAVERQVLGAVAFGDEVGAATVTAALSDSVRHDLRSAMVLLVPRSFDVVIVMALPIPTVLSKVTNLFDLLVQRPMLARGAEWGKDWPGWDNETWQPTRLGVYIFWRDEYDLANGNPPVYIGEGQIGRRVWTSEAIRDKWQFAQILYHDDISGPSVTCLNWRRLVERFAIVVLNPEENRG